MRRLFFTILFTGIAAAHAAEAPVAKPAGLPATGLTLNDCLLVLDALKTIDEHIVVIGKEPNQQLVKLPYEYGPGGFRLNMIGHNIRVLTDLQQIAQDEQRKILNGILAKMPPKDDKPATEIAANTPEAIEYDRKLKELTAAPCVADLTHFKESDLKLDKNELPASALANLEKIRDK